MSKINFDKRTIYCKLTWDEQFQKKSTFFGGSWGSMEKRDANATAIKTGDGLVVLDIDTQDLKEIDKGIRKELEKLGTATVKTARGYHWYFYHKNSAEFINKASYSKLVDVRSDGGIIFNQYLGKNPNIMYKRTGKVYEKMPKKLHKLLKKAMQSSRKNLKKRSQWERPPDGEKHDTVIRYIMKDFYNGLSYDEVIANALEFTQKYLGGTQREINLMLERVKWGYDKRLENKLDEQKPVSDEPEDMGGDFEEDEIVGRLLKAEQDGALELAKVMKHIKKKLKLSMATQHEMLREAHLNRSGEGLDEYFKGRVMWDDLLGRFVEVNERGETYYSKPNFIQTVMSNSGFLKSTGVSDMLAHVPTIRVIYKPTEERGEMTINETKHFNLYHKTHYTGDHSVKKIPKTINKILDNLFLSDPKAKDVFLNWLAVIVQKGIRTGVAWGFFGASGSGKGFVSDIIRLLLGGTNCSMNVSDNDLQSAFNPYMQNKQFIHLNEVASDFHGRHGVAGHIKAMIGDTYVRVNSKGVTEIEIENFSNVILNSNKPNPIELDFDDRRWNMIVSDQSLTACKWWKGDKTYQKGLKEFNAFGKYLMAYDINISDAQKPMAISKAKEKVIMQTTDPLQLVGNAINHKDFEKVSDLLLLDNDDFGFDFKELKESCESGIWSNTMLTRIYAHVTGYENITVMMMAKRFKAPYLKGSNYRTMNIRGFKVS